MKKINELLLLVSAILSFTILYKSASLYLTRRVLFDFDSQNLLLWNYASKVGILPYKDIFFPYGIFFYFLNGSLFFNFLFFGFVTLFFVFIFFIFRTINKSLFVTIFSLAIISLSIFWVSGAYSVVRYGFFLVIVCFVFLQTGKVSNSKIYTYIGVATGLVISLFLDQGLYAAGVSLVTIFLNDYFFNRKKFNVNILWNSLHFLSGILVGIIPLIAYLYVSNSFIPFINSLTSLSEITSYAKTPFLHSLRNFPGLFNIGILFVASSVAGYRLLYKKEVPSNQLKLFIGVTVVLFILEQKSVVRSIDEQIMYIGVVILLLIINPLLARLKYMFILIVLLFLTLFISAISAKQNYFHNEFNTQKYTNVLKKTNGNVFSIPSDPVFYILNNQIPPYFSNIYDASSINSQERQINYLKTKNVENVVLNLKTKSIQDGVPDYMRTPKLYSYIFRNYGNIEYMDGDFVVISKGGDFIKSNKFKNNRELVGYFSDINLGKIPASEGKYKSGYIKDVNYFKNQNELNYFLNKNDIYSKNNYLIIYPNSKANVNTILINETKVHFDTCEEQYPCIINISNLPLFYKNRIIERVSITNLEKVGLFSGSNNIFW